MLGPFQSSQTLADWTNETLSKRDIDSFVKWRMLEHWMQPELYRAVEKGDAGNWRHLGEGEQPYFTALPRKTSSFEVKWIDLVFAQPVLENPQHIIWFELKHIGRSQDRLKSNASDLGNDTAALYAINPIRTKEVWLHPPSSVLNASKVELWSRYGPQIDLARHYIAQVVLVPKMLVDIGNNDHIIRHSWIKSFEKRSTLCEGHHSLEIARSDTKCFAIYALVGEPQQADLC